MCGGDDSPAYEQVNLLGQAFRFAGVRLDRKPLEKDMDVVERSDGRVANGAVAIVRLKERVDEEAALEVLVPKPLVKGLKGREQLASRGRAALARLGLEPVPEQELMVAFDDFGDEVVLRPEVPVERRLCDACLRDDRLPRRSGRGA